jgi:hypothetical protein
MYTTVFAPFVSLYFQNYVERQYVSGTGTCTGTELDQMTPRIDPSINRHNAHSKTLITMVMSTNSNEASAAAQTKQKRSKRKGTPK